MPHKEETKLEQHGIISFLPWKRDAFTCQCRKLHLFPIRILILLSINQTLKEQWGRCISALLSSQLSPEFSVSIYKSYCGVGMMTQAGMLSMFTLKF